MAIKHDSIQSFLPIQISYNITHEKNANQKEYSE